MVKTRILVAWIGHADIRGMASFFPEDQRKAIIKEAGLREATPTDTSGPIKTLLESESFDIVHLLSNYPPSITKHIVKWIGTEVTVHEIGLKDPTDYPAVFESVNKTLAHILEESSQQTDLCIHLSPGTPTMTAIWVLLGKTRFPATFYQTHAGRAWKTEIPFNVAIDYLPDLLRDPDIHLQHLASHAPQEITGFEQIIGTSHAIRIAAGRAMRAAVRDVSILLVGESGTGKELFAQAIHNASRRKNKPFKVLNCAAIPGQLLESELFGHRKGAFTGADKDRAGLFKVADGGTLFLDEIGECPIDLQAKLLRVLQPPSGKNSCFRVFTPVGSSKEEASDVRIIAATNRDLIKEIHSNHFREDLFYRLSVISVRLPPLRERKEDVIPLAETLLDRINAEFRRQEPGYEYKFLSGSTKIFMKSYNWSGNIRQLHNAIVQAAVMSKDKKIEKTDIQEALAESSPMAIREDESITIPEGGINLEDHLNSIRQKYLREAMGRAGGNKSKAARMLGIRNYQTLDAQMKRLGVEFNKDS